MTNSSKNLGDYLNLHHKNKITFFISHANMAAQIENLNNS